MPFSTTPYCTLSQLHAALGLVDTSDDSFLTELIGEAQGMLDEKIGYPFQVDGTVPSPATRIYNGNDTSTLFIDDCQSFSQVTLVIQTITLSGSIYTQGTPTVLDITADCKLWPYNNAARGLPAWKLVRMSGLTFDAGQANVTVKGVFGYTTIPPEVSRACVRLVTHWYKMRDTAYAQQLLETGGVKLRYTQAIPEDVQQLIDAKRHRSFLTR